MPIMRCPVCQDEYEPDVRSCAGCGVSLVPDGSPVPVRTDARLGEFHPVAARAVTALLDRRGIAHATQLHDERATLLVEPDWRDELRAELAIRWGELVRSLPYEEFQEVTRSGGRQPGWFDAPEGGWIDREGRMLVDSGEEEDGDNRLLGPVLLTLGAVLAGFAWYADAGAGIVFAGLALAIFGLLSPR